MSELNKLAKSLKEIENQLTDCMKCGMCQAVCPVFKQTGDEGDVARGKIFRLERLAEEMLTDAKGAKTRIEKCLMCGTCAANCPSEVKILASGAGTVATSCPACMMQIRDVLSQNHDGVKVRHVIEIYADTIKD